MVRIERADAALVGGDIAGKVRGVAGMTAINAAFIDALPKLEIIANIGVGYDFVDARHAAARGVMVTNTPDVLTEEVADTALGLLLNTVRELPRAEQWLRQGRWEKEGPYPLTRPRCAAAASASSAWAASALPLPAGSRRSACRSPTTTGARSKGVPYAIPSDAARPGARRSTR